MNDKTASQDGSQPGVLGDFSQAQDLGQPGHPEDRVTETDVEAAFQDGGAGAPQDGSQPGVLGDFSQAQDLGQKGHPEDRVTQSDVAAAFPAKGAITRPITPTPAGQAFDQLAKRVDKAEDRQEALIDESLEESFPASDPPSAKKIT